MTGNTAVGLLMDFQSCGKSNQLNGVPMGFWSRILGVNEMPRVGCWLQSTYIKSSIRIDKNLYKV